MKKNEFITAALQNAKHKKLLSIGPGECDLFSYSRPLLDNGWEGTLVEPGKKLYKILKRNTKELSVKCYNYALVPDNAGIITIYDAGIEEGMTTTSKQYYNKNKEYTDYRQKTVTAVTPSQLFKLVGLDYDFLEICVPGLVQQALEAFPWQELTDLKCLCITHDDKCDHLKVLLFHKKYNRVYYNSEISIFVKL